MLFKFAIIKNYLTSFIIEIILKKLKITKIIITLKFKFKV